MTEKKEEVPINECTVVTKAGEFVLHKHNAGARNNALIMAETAMGKYAKEPNKTVFITELLPSCITKHPFGLTKITDGLKQMQYKEYDKLTKALGELMAPPESDELKK